MIALISTLAEKSGAAENEIKRVYHGDGQKSWKDYSNQLFYTAKKTLEPLETRGTIINQMKAYEDSHLFKFNRIYESLR